MDCLVLMRMRMMVVFGLLKMSFRGRRENTEEEVERQIVFDAAAVDAHVHASLAD